MRFVYKINSAYDGFRPESIPQRLRRGRVTLHWKQYIETVESRAEVWIYFRGPHRFADGVYLKGRVASVDVAHKRVVITASEYSTEEPLTDQQTTRQIARLVARPYQQVFVFPEAVEAFTGCTLATTARSCANHHCRVCPLWQRLPRINPHTLARPERLPWTIEYAPAYWVVPERSFLFYTGRSIRPKILSVSETFMRFKTGERNLAFPLALGMHAALERRGLLEFDGVVPVPLSPDKARAGELHRTRVLALELARLLKTPKRELLSLKTPISKRRLRRDRGYTPSQFEDAYSKKLTINTNARRYRRLLLVDDVCTHGSTLRAIVAALTDASERFEIVACTAGQMAVRSAVSDEDKLLV